MVTTVITATAVVLCTCDWFDVGTSKIDPLLLLLSVIPKNPHGVKGTNWLKQLRGVKSNMEKRDLGS